MDTLILIYCLSFSVYLIGLRIAIFPALLKDDLVRRDVSDSQLFKTLIWIPLLGPLIYFCIRPPFGEQITATPPTSQASQT